VPGLTAAAPRARIDPLDGRPVTLTAVHPLAPTHGHADIWQRELTLIRQALAEVDGPQLVAGDFNASRDHRPFQDLLAAGFRDCADFSQSRSWPGFTWPAAGGMLPVMRLDHVLVSRTATVRTTRAIRVPRTDHHGMLAAIEFTKKTDELRSSGAVGPRSGVRTRCGHRPLRHRHRRPHDPVPAAGLVRTLVFSQTVGAGCLGAAYVTANQVPNLLYELVLGGALTSVMVPVLARSAERAASTAAANC
jgi:Lipid II flippase MurJ/Endonuclease/Exonuclease/phosphatase family